MPQEAEKAKARSDAARDAATIVEVLLTLRKAAESVTFIAESIMLPAAQVAECVLDDMPALFWATLSAVRESFAGNRGGTGDQKGAGATGDGKATSNAENAWLTRAASLESIAGAAATTCTQPLAAIAFAVARINDVPLQIESMITHGATLLQEKFAPNAEAFAKGQKLVGNLGGLAIR